MSPRYLALLMTFKFLFVSIVYPATITINPDIEYQTVEEWGTSSNFYENIVARMPQEACKEAFDYVYSDLI